MLHQQTRVVLCMSYFVRQIFLWGCSFPHDSVHFVRQLPFQNPNLFGFNTTKHTSKNTVLLAGWTTDYRSETAAMMITVHLRRRAFSSVTRVTLSNHLPAVSDRCRESGFFDPQRGHWTGYHALWSHTLSPADHKDAFLFICNPPLTSTSYCHVVSWGSCHAAQSPHHHSLRCINTYNSFYNH